MKIRIGTRGSDLALWQAHTVADWLRAEDGVEVEIVVLQTRGDAIDDRPLSTVGGKDFFTAEIERALLDRSVDVAVHSHKDLATDNPPGLAVVGVPARGPDRERLLVLPRAWDPAAPFLPLVRGACVGTSAPRRRDQLLALRPDLEVLDLRGNVPTRVNRLREERYEAVVLAAAGLERLALDLSDLETTLLDRSWFVPAPAQGALAIQVRTASSEGEPFDLAVRELVERRIHDPATERAIRAERRVLSAAGGGCSLPLGANARREGDGFRMLAFLGADHPDAGAPARWVDVLAPTPEAAGERAVELLAAGAPTNSGPLAGRRIAVTGSGHEGRLAQRLRTLGATVVLERVLEFVDVEHANESLARHVAQLQPGDAVAVTSRRAVQCLAKGCAVGRVPAGVTLGAVGPTTADALREHGLEVQVVGSGGALELARELPIAAGRTVVFPSATEPREDLETELETRGVRVTRVPVYTTRPVPEPAGDPAVDLRIYTSPSAVRALAAWEAARVGKGIETAGSTLALGRATWDALQALGLTSGEPPRGSGPDALIDELGREARAWTRNTT